MFHPEKIGDRWWMCNPLGTVQWLTGLAGVFPPSDSCAGGLEGQCSDYQTRITAKYSNSLAWGTQQIRRMRLWGFNAVGQQSTGVVYPTGDQPEKLPYLTTVQPSQYAAINMWNRASRPIKNLRLGLNANYTEWRASVLDFFDSQFPVWMDGYFANERNLNSPWLLGSGEWARAPTSRLFRPGTQTRTTDI
jgi:hypothetical protein